MIPHGTQAASSCVSNCFLHPLKVICSSGGPQQTPAPPPLTSLHEPSPVATHLAKIARAGNALK